MAARLRNPLKALAAAIGVAASLAAACASAGGAILPEQPIVNGDMKILELGGAAISSDGTGGVVFAALDGGVRHVFASLLRDGAWSPPLRVDKGQQFDSFSPRIAAGDGGRVVVVWVQKGPVSGGLRHDQLYSAGVDPGAAEFKNPVPVDLDVGPGDYVSPDVSMNPVGYAYVVYRALTATSVQDSSIPTSDARVRVKLARYNGFLWSRLDQDVNRNGASTVRFPKPANAPKVAIDYSGNGVVAFQEPDDSFISRIWIRRIFGSSLGLPLLASPATVNGDPLRGEADGIALAGGGEGNAVVGFRQAPGNPPKLDRTRIMFNLLPETVSPQAGTLAGPVTAAMTDSGAGGDPGVPVVAQNEISDFTMLYPFGGAVQRTRGSAVVAPAYDTLGAETESDGAQYGAGIGFDRGETDARFVPGPGGDGVELTERLADGTSNAAVFGGVESGAAALDFAGNGSGDGALAMLSRSAGADRLSAVVVDSPPDYFNVRVPSGWVRTERPQLRWDQSFDALGGSTYEVRIDGRLAGTTRAPKLVLGKNVRDGRHTATITAVDRIGQRYASRAFAFDIDRRAPRVRLSRGGSGVISVKLSDGRRGAGVSRRTIVRWGDGGKDRFTKSGSHRYRQPGTVKVTVIAYDKAGNRRVAKRLFVL